MSTCGWPSRTTDIDVDMRLAEPHNRAQKHDWRVWSPSTKPGEIMDDELNPVLYRV